MRVIRAQEAPRFELPDVEFAGLAAPSRGSAEVCTWQITVAPGSSSAQSHTLDRDEIFVVTEGELRLAPQAPLLAPGDAAIVPAGTPIQLVNGGERPARAYVVIRAGFSATMQDGTPVGTPPWAC